jgi:hypothetical protein
VGSGRLEKRRADDRAQAVEPGHGALQLALGPGRWDMKAFMAGITIAPTNQLSSSANIIQPRVASP